MTFEEALAALRHSINAPDNQPYIGGTELCLLALAEEVERLRKEERRRWAMEKPTTKVQFTSELHLDCPESKDVISYVPCPGDEDGLQVRVGWAEAGDMSFGIEQISDTPPVESEGDKLMRFFKGE